MTTTQKQKEGLLTPDSKYLAHFTSPIATAAAKANYQPFTYHFEGYNLRIGKEMVDELRKISDKHLGICNKLLENIAGLLIETNGEFAEFLSIPIEDANLSTRTYHMLKGHGECKTLLDVAKLGSRRVSELRMLGPKSVAEVRALFVKAGCVELFDTAGHE